MTASSGSALGSVQDMVDGVQVAGTISSLDTGYGTEWVEVV
jgi:hypothetical protein